MEARKVSTTIPVSEVPFVMRALGFYPSEQEVCKKTFFQLTLVKCHLFLFVQIQDMLNEIKFSTYVDTGEYKSEVDMDDFIRRKNLFFLLLTHTAHTMFLQLK